MGTEYNASRRHEIVRSAAKVFARYGYSGASMAAIADAASMHKGGLYFYFKTKAEIALAVVETQSQRSSVHVDAEAAAETSPLLKMVKITLALARESLVDPILAASVRLSLESDEFASEWRPYDSCVALFERLSAQAIQAGEFDPKLSVEFFARSLATSFIGATLMVHSDQTHIGLEASMRQLWYSLLPGIVNVELFAAVQQLIEHNSEAVLIA